MTIAKCYGRPVLPGNLDPFFRKEFGISEEGNSSMIPAANILESENTFIIEMMVPGFSREDIQIRLEKDVLTISSEKEENQEERDQYTRKEFSLRKFKRSYLLPKTVDLENITAEAMNGILKVSLPKKEEARVNISREIAVN